MNKKKIIIFGRGEFFKAKKEYFLEHYNIIAFLDNSVNDTQIDLCVGVPVLNPKDVFQLPSCEVYCVSSDFISMWRQLIEIGVDDSRIKFGAMVPPMQEGVESLAFANGEIIYSEDKKLFYESSLLGKQQLENEDDLKKMVRDIVYLTNGTINEISKYPVIPVSRTFGSDRGKAVDRYYIEKFLSDNSQSIKGTVLEVANNRYTLQFGGNSVKESIVSHVKGWGKGTVICNFESGLGVQEEKFDCIICTQTLQYIFDVQSAINNIYRMLKPGGVALITVPGIKPLCRYDNENWGEYWSFTVKSMEKMCLNVCNKENVNIKQFGNVKAATAYLYGICIEELSVKDLEYNDSQYPFLICVSMKKKER